MKIGFIGAGKVGFTLGKYFVTNNIEVAGYFSQNINSAKEASQFTETHFFQTVSDLVTQCDMIFITVSDTAIESVWNLLKEMDISNKVICHCSGALSSDVFSNISESGAYGYSVHPFFAISSKHQSYVEISKAFFTIEGDNKYLSYLKELIEKLGNKVFIIDKNQKTKYHASAVFLSNFINCLAYTGTKILKECGFEEEFISNALATLFIKQCENISQNGVIDSLTGPVERNDLATITKHINCLNGIERQLYINLTQQLIEVAQIKNTRDYSSLEEMLKSVEETKI